MNTVKADGLKTENAAARHAPGGNLENLVEAQLAVLTEGMRAAFARAAEIDPQKDEYGHARGNHVGTAVSIAKSSAKLVLAAAKVRGKFDHNINVTRRPVQNVVEVVEDDGLFEAAYGPQWRERYRADAAKRGIPPSKI